MDPYKNGLKKKKNNKMHGVAYIDQYGVHHSQLSQHIITLNTYGSSLNDQDKYTHSTKTGTIQLRRLRFGEMPTRDGKLSPAERRSDRAAGFSAALPRGVNEAELQEARDVTPKGNNNTHLVD
jgi:hypothetical protein